MKSIQIDCRFSNKKDVTIRLVMVFVLLLINHVAYGLEETHLYFYSQYIDSDSMSLVFTLFFFKYPGQEVYFRGETYDALKPTGNVDVSNITMTVYRKRVEPYPPVYHKTVKYPSGKYWTFDKNGWEGKNGCRVRLTLNKEMMDYWSNWWDYYVTFDATLTANIIGKAYTIPWFSHNLADHPDYPVDIVRVGTLVVSESTQGDATLTSEEMVEYARQINYAIPEYYGANPESIKFYRNDDGSYNIFLDYGDVYHVGGLGDHGMRANCYAVARVTRKMEQKTKYLIAQCKASEGTKETLHIVWQERWKILTKDCRNAFPKDGIFDYYDVVNILKKYWTYEKVDIDEKFEPIE